MRRALSLFAAAVVMLVSAPAFADAGADAGKDSGIGTVASPNNPTIPVDSGMASTPTEPTGSDSGGCSVVSSSSSSSSGGWSTVLGLVTAASILVLSRRGRRAGR
jgi:hypothetical protein